LWSTPSGLPRGFKKRVLRHCGGAIHSPSKRREEETTSSLRAINVVGSTTLRTFSRTDQRDLIREPLGMSGLKEGAVGAVGE
jgi:hypothetical protein